MGLAKLELSSDVEVSEGAKDVVKRANEVLGFA